MSDLAEIQIPNLSFRILQDIAADLAKPELAFPTFSNATMKIRQALDDPNVDSNRLARLVAGEPLLSIKIVKMANSAGLGGIGKPVNDVPTAIARVGFKIVRMAAISLAMAQLQAATKLGKHAKRGEAAWIHSVNVGALAYVIAQKTSRLSPDEALFAGLVHDIGYFYLLSIVDRYEELSRDTETLESVLREWHAPVGQSVLHAFNFPDTLLDAVSEHEADHYAFPPNTIGGLIRIANRVTSDTNPNYFGVASPHPPMNEPGLTQLLADSDMQLRALRNVLKM